MALLALGGALALLAVGGPRWLAAFAKLVGDPAMASLYAAEALLPPSYDRVVDSRLAALDQVEDPLSWSELGFAYMVAAERNDDLTDEGRRILLDTARESFIASIELAPSQAITWSQLAYLEQQSARDEEARTLLATGFRFGTYEPVVARQRAWLCLVTMPEPPGPEQPAAADACDQQFRLAATREPAFLAAAAIATDSLGRIETALASAPPEVIETLVGRLAALAEPMP